MLKRLITALSALALVACGSSISPQLVDARQRVQEAQDGVAARLNPDEVLEAQRTLEAAERASDGSQVEIDLAYIAERKARLAMVNANAAQLRGEIDQEEAQYREQLEDVARARQQALDVQGEMLTAVRTELANVRSELEERGDTLDDRTRELRAREAELSQRVDQLMEARTAQAAAEARAAAAMDRLREMMAVREEQDQTVITLNGEVLFEYDEASLRDAATRRLDAVAEALSARPDAQIVIEGHTDAQGSDAYNRRLSQQRARAVERFLVGRGLEDDRIETIGRGESEPIATNDTPEGRANNRRVEIILRNPSTSG